MAAFLAPGMTRRSLFGVAFVAALAVVGLFLLFDYNQTDRAKGDEIRLGNAVAAELQSAALTVQRLSALDAAQIAQERARLRENIIQLKGLHAELRGSDGRPRPRGLSADALALFLDPPGRLDQTLRIYIADLIVIAEAGSQDSAASQAATRAVLAKAEPLRDSLADFVRVQANGKIAMKLDKGDRLVGVWTCSEAEDVLLSARGGKCIRFPVSAVRVFRGRDSTGVRGIRLGKGDEVISMSILKHVEASPEERTDYLRAASTTRRLVTAEPDAVDADGEALAAKLAEPPFAKMAKEEEFILSLTENGYGKRSSAYDYRITGRGGQGIVNIETSTRNGKVVASFPVEHSDHIVLVSDGGQIIRVPVAGISIMGRSTQGVGVFNVAEDEKVVSVTWLAEEDDDGGNGGGDNEGGAEDNARGNGAAQDLTGGGK